MRDDNRPLGQKVDRPMSNKKYIVLWKDNLRLGSVEHTPGNLTQLKLEFHLGLIQRDMTGTDHYAVWGVK